MLPVKWLTIGCLLAVSCEERTSPVVSSPTSAPASAPAVPLASSPAEEAKLLFQGASPYPWGDQTLSRAEQLIANPDQKRVILNATVSADGFSPGLHELDVDLFMAPGERFIPRDAVIVGKGVKIRLIRSPFFKEPVQFKNGFSWLTVRGLVTFAGEPQPQPLKNGGVSTTIDRTELMDGEITLEDVVGTPFGSSSKVFVFDKG